MSYPYPLIKYYKLKVQKMIQSQNLVNELSYAFIDLQWVMKSHALAGDVPNQFILIP